MSAPEWQFYKALEERYNSVLEGHEYPVVYADQVWRPLSARLQSCQAFSDEIVFKIGQSSGLTFGYVTQTFIRQDDVHVQFLQTQEQ